MSIDVGNVLITGCSDKSLGAALAKRFAVLGYHVYATVRDQARASSLQDDPNISVVTLDVASLESIASLRQDLETSHSATSLDVLVNCAGILATGPLIDADPAVARRLYEVNVLGVLNVTQAFVPLLRQGRSGAVIANVSSVGGLLAMPWGGLYHSSKAAVTILSETLRLELAPLGIKVITGMLGNIESNVHNNDAWSGLPESSPYKVIESHIAKSASGEAGPPKEDQQKFATRFVKDILEQKGGMVWRGTKAQTVRIMAYHAPMGLLDSMLTPGSGLDVMAKQAKD